MKLFYVFTAILVSVVIESGDAVDCYNCDVVPFDSSSPAGCNDPFNAQGIPTVTCNGKCAVNFTMVTAPQGSFTEVHRSCSPASECEFITNGCATFTNPPEAGGGSTQLCAACCDTNTCNSMSAADIEAAGADALKCWSCEEIGADMTGSCSSPNFNGEGAQEVSCVGPLLADKCASIKSPAVGDEPAAFRRTCNVANACTALANLPGYEILCCEGNLCNIGSDATPATTTKPGKDDDKEGTIQCYECDSPKANDTDKMGVCEMGKFPADGVQKVECPSGKCFSVTLIPPKDVKDSERIFRGCLLPGMEKLGYCEDGENSKDAECCTKDLCNKGSAGIVAINVALMLCALLTGITFV